MSLSSVYQPVEPEFYEAIEEYKKDNQEIKIFYFSERLELISRIGSVDTIVQEGRAEHLKLNTGETMRLDRIITLNGKPGPLYEYYESFGNACLDCKPTPDME